MLLLAALVTSGCATLTTRRSDSEVALQATRELSEEELLDVGIQVFDPGVSVEAGDVPEGVYPDIRRAEARFMAYQLKDTLERTGHWGSVHVVPDDSVIVELLVTARIEESNGAEARLEARAVDATGRTWLDRAYATRTTDVAFRDDADKNTDPYQSLFNMIANDLVRERSDLDPEELAGIRTVSELRFAVDLAPDAFEDYLESNGRDRFELRRLPAEGDPTLQRVEQLRDREQLFLDTLDERNAGFRYEMLVPYWEWRKSSRMETLAFEKLRGEALKRALAGIGLMAGSIACALYTETPELCAVTGVAGVELVRTGFDKHEESKIHAIALEELGGSFESEVAPIVVEMEGHTVRLTGTARAQYAEWRRLLREFYLRETGFDGPMAIRLEDALPEEPTRPDATPLADTPLQPAAPGP